VFVIDWGLVTVQPGRDYRFTLPEILIEGRSFAFEDRLIEDTRGASTCCAIFDTETGAIPPRKTGASPPIGTPAYMAPEQCRNNTSEMGAISDVWAFGVMLFEAVTGQHPIPEHRNLGPLEITRRVLQLGPLIPRSIRPDVPESLDSLCAQMLIPPDWRMRSLKPFIAALERLEHQ
jgi:serine/threonine protein kinase